MYKILFSISLLLLCLSACKSGEKSQATKTDTETTATKAVDMKEIGVAFYNIENLFDTEDDPKIEDEDFTPDGKYAWTEDKYKIKLANIAKVIAQLAKDGPEFFGLVEIENAGVVRDLLSQKALTDIANYKLVHENSQDARGVDVAFCYNPAVFTYVAHKAFAPKFSDASKKSRDFLLVEGKVAGEVMYVIVNHWPSRRGGQQVSEIFRVEEATHVRQVCDSVLKKNSKAHIIVMGDFNDDPSNKSISEIMGAKGSATEAAKSGFFNTMTNVLDPNAKGSLTYEGKWNLFDQFLLSSNLVNGKSKVKYLPNSADVFSPEWLKVGFGKGKDNPKRSIFRDKFQDDGYSDHFPVQMLLQVK